MEKVNESKLMARWALLMKSSSPENVRVRFDEESDELLVNLTPERFRDVSVYVVPNIAVRVSPDRSQIYGLQIENFVSAMAPKFPELLTFLDWADLDDHVVMRIRRLVNSEVSALVGEKLIEDVSRLAGAAD